MSVSLSFLDTNVLLYAFDDGAAQKQRVARRMIEELGRTRTGVLSTQVLIELFHTLTRKFKISRKTASLMTSAFCEWQVIESDTPLVLHSMARATEQQLSIWDAMVVEAALKSGATTLYSEDMQHGQRMGSLTIINPFA